MKIWHGIGVGLLFAAGLVRGADVAPETAREHVVLHTIAGDIVLALYPGVAPKTVAQFLKLVRLGVYDTTHFYRIEPHFVAQVGTAEDRLLPLREAQSAAIQKIPAEISTLKHKPWALSMAHEDGDVNSAATSFSILLVDAPHLDGQYTIFGHVERGFGAVLELLKATRDDANRPMTRLTIERAEVAETPEALARLPYVGPRAVIDPAKSDPAQTSELRKIASFGVLLMMLLSLGGWYLGRGVSRRAAAFSLLNVFAGSFLLVLFLTGFSSPRTPWIGTALFAGLFGVFRLMSRFEAA